jgi:molybdate transport system substrate-binding protein
MSSKTTQAVGISCRPVASLLSALILSVTATLANADEIRVLSGGGPQAALQAIIPEFEMATGHRVHPTFTHVSVIQQKLAAGEKADLILLPVPLLAATEKSLALRPEGRIVFARVGIAVIVHKGMTLPDISTPEAVRELLLDARSIEIPPPNGPAGGHIARMIEQLGIAEAVRPKLVIKAAIDSGAELVTEGNVDVAMQLLSEVQSAKDIAVVGLLPSTLQSLVVYGTAIPAYNDRPEPAVTLARFLSEPNKKDFWTAAGFELLDAGN